MALQGTLDTFALPDVLRLLAATRKSGWLRISGDRGTGDVCVSEGEVAAIDVPAAPLAVELVDGLFELLRFEEGTFDFDPEPVEHSGSLGAVDPLLESAEGLLAEWREIEAVVPSPDSWVSLRPELPAAEAIVDQAQWATIVAIGAGTSVEGVGQALELPELPTARSIRDLVEGGLVDISRARPAVTLSQPTAGERPAGDDVDEAAETPLGFDTLDGWGFADEVEADADQPAEHEQLDPLGQIDDAEASAPDDGVEDVVAEAGDDTLPADVEDLAAAFPGLADRLAPQDPPAAEAATDAEPTDTPASSDPAEGPATPSATAPAAGEAGEDPDEPLDRGLLLKFLSSVKS